MARVAVPTDGQPWRSREDWAQGRIVSSDRGWVVAGSWIAALIVLLVSSPIPFLLRREIDRGNRLALFGLVFPVAGLLLLATAIRRTLLWTKFGASTLILRATPVPPGGRLVGTIRAREMPPPAGGYRLRLTCARRRTTGSGKSRTTHETILWRDERVMERALDGGEPGRTEIPVSFAIPAEALVTTLGDPDDRILWALEAEAAVPGLDYCAEFEVPVFGPAVATGAGDDPMLACEAPEEPFRPGSDPGIRVGPSAGGGVEFFFGPWRNPGASLGLAAFLALWTCAVAFLLKMHAPMIFAIVFGGFELVILCITLGVTIGTTRLVIEAGEARLTRGLLGVGPTRILRCADLGDIRMTIGMQTGERAGTPYYALALVDRTGATYSAGGNIRDKREAEWLAAEMKRRISACA